MKAQLPSVLAVSLLAAAASGQIVVPGSDQNIGPFVFNGTLDGDGDNNVMTIDLGFARTGNWADPEADLTGYTGVPDGIPDGVYDYEKWAVVFKYSEVTIPSGKTVRFTNHPSRAPVVWLVQGDVTIHGFLHVDGSSGHAYNIATYLGEPGPGGFRGGLGSAADAGCGGLGVGGASLGDASSAGSGGGYGTVGGVGSCGGGAGGQGYGNAGVFPLIGGSGGSGAQQGESAAGAGGGGGALLIAAQGTILLNDAPGGAAEGFVHANGGAGAGGPWNGCTELDGGGGGGGGIRLVCDTITGTGRLEALPGQGGNYDGDGGYGRIRVEANVNALTDIGNPLYSSGLPGDTARLWPDDGTPSVRCVTLGGQPVPADPRANHILPGTDLSFAPGPGGTLEADLVIETKNVPTLTSTVTVRVVPLRGQDFTVTATFDQGDDSLALWTATISLANGFATLQARAGLTP